MKKLIFLMILLLLSVLVIVSCKENVPESTKDAVTQPIESSPDAVVTTLPRGTSTAALTTAKPTQKETTATPVTTTEAPVSETEPKVTTTKKAPETTVPETTVPETTVPETTVPETTVPETTVPETTVPETTVPETTVPEVTVPEVTVPEVTVPEVTVPEVTVPEVTEPEVTVPEVTVPEVTVPEVTVPEVTVPEVTVPEVTVPEVTEPEVTVPEVTVPEVTVPEVTEPEVTEPEVTVPEVTEPEVTEPEVTVPEVTEPEVTVPEVTEPEVTVPDTTVPEIIVPDTTVVPETSAAPITYTSKNWMGALPDETFLNEIAIPGTHDSGATKDMIISGTAKCQTLSIADQLAAGVRFFDIRLRRVNGSLHVYHGDVDQSLTFDQVLSACYTFLTANPSETVIMCIKEETDASGTNAAFDAMVAAKINEQASFWHTNPTVPTLGAVRGKIVLMRRYSTSGSFGINASSGWTDNATFTLNAGSSTLSVQDYYNNDSADAKWSAVTAMFQKMKYQKNVYYLNYTSGYKSGLFGIPNINTIKNAVNPKLIEYLKTSPDFVGIVVVDFVTAEIAELIYEVNFD